MPATKQQAALQESGAAIEQEFCWQAHLKGHDVRSIARMASEHFGKSFSATTAWRRIEAERVELRQSIRRMAEEDRDVQLARLDGLITEAVAQAERARRQVERSAQVGAFDVHAEDRLDKAVARIAALTAQQAKLLGLDVVNVNVSGTIEHVDAADVELARLLDHVPAKAPADA